LADGTRGTWGQGKCTVHAATELTTIASVGVTSAVANGRRVVRGRVSDSSKSTESSSGATVSVANLASTTVGNLKDTKNATADSCRAVTLVCVSRVSASNAVVRVGRGSRTIL